MASAAGSPYVQCSWCGNDFLRGRSISAHLRQCPDKPQLLWECLPAGRESNKRARTKVEANATILQVERQLNADIHAAHKDGFSADFYRIGAMPPLPNLHLMAKAMTSFVTHGMI